MHSTPKPVLSFLAALALTVCTFAVARAATNDPIHLHTKAGMERAKSVLLTGADLGRGWLSGPVKTPGHIIASCTGRLTPNQSDLVEIGEAAEFSNLGVRYVLQTAAVYGTAAAADAAWSRTMAASPMACMNKTLKHIQVRPTKDSRLRLSSAAPGVVGYRVVGHYKAYGQPVTMYLDQLLVHDGSTVTRLFLTSFNHTFSEPFEDSLVRNIEKRFLAGSLRTGPSA